MKQEIDKIYNQIHAPKELVLQTKENVHKEMNVTSIQRNSHRKWVVREAMAVACILLVVTAIWLLQKGSDQMLEGQKIEIPMGQVTPIQSVEFSSVESLQQFHKVLKKMKEGNKNRHPLLKSYTIGTGTIKAGETTYHITLNVKNGVLLRKDSLYTLDGTLVIIVKNEIGERKEYEIGTLKNTTQFTKENKEGFIVQTKQNGNQFFVIDNGIKQTSYTVNQDGNIMIILE